MEKTRVKVLGVVVGNYNCDSIIVNLNGEKTEICFSKEVGVEKFNDKEVFLSSDANGFNIELITGKR